MIVHPVAAHSQSVLAGNFPLPVVIEYLTVDLHRPGSDQLPGLIVYRFTFKGQGAAAVDFSLRVIDHIDAVNAVPPADQLPVRVIQLTGGHFKRAQAVKQSLPVVDLPGRDLLVAVTFQRAPCIIQECQNAQPKLLLAVYRPGGIQQRPGIQLHHPVRKQFPATVIQYPA
ncbi:hypothetical protein PSI17_14745 [Xenorhabdus sp. IM139775]|nr:hypothetical protein [Xenorhabdus sp. IM139775]